MTNPLTKKLATFYFFAYGASGAFFPIIPLILSKRGLSPSQISWVLIVNSVSGVIVPPIWGYIADRFQIREKLLRVVSIGCTLTVLLLIFPRTLAGTLLAMGTFCLFRATIAALADATTYVALGPGESSRFGTVRAWGSLSFAIATALAGVFSASDHSGWLFFSCSVLYFGAAVVSPIVKTPGTVQRAKTNIGHAFAETMRSGLGWVLLANAFYYGAHTVFDTFFSLYVKTIGRDEIFGSIGWAIAVLSEVAVMLRARTLIAGKNASHLLIFAAAVSTFRWFALSIVTHPVLLLALQVLHGITFGLWYLALVAHVQAKVLEEVRTSVQAVLLGSLAVGSVAGAFFAGEILEHLGGAWLFTFAGVMSFVALALYAWARIDRAERMKRHYRRRLVFSLGVAGVAILFGPRLFPETTLRSALYFERTLARLDEKEIVASNHTIRYLEGGPNDAPVLLLLHGFGGDKDNWTRMSRGLTKDYRVIAPDLPGFGQSTAINAERYDIASQADRVDAFARALKLPPHHVAGNSMGGNLAGAYAVRFPANVKSVAFFANSGIKAPRESEFAVRRARGEHPLLVETREQYDAMMKMVFVERPWVPAPLLDHFAQQAIKQRAFREKIFKDLDANPYPLEPVLAGIQVPALILWGKEDRLLDVSSVEVMKPLLPSAKVVILDAVGHVPMIEQPAVCADAYVEFLRATGDNSQKDRTTAGAPNTTHP